MIAVWLGLLFPLLGFLWNALVGRAYPRALAGRVASAAVGASFVCALVVFVSLMALPGDQRHVVTQLYPWIVADRFQVELALLVDPLSSFMMLIVTGVGFLIHVYATGYMRHEVTGDDVVIASLDHTHTPTPAPPHAHDAEAITHRHGSVVHSHEHVAHHHDHTIHPHLGEQLRYDKGYVRFFAYMNLFVLAMLVLVLAASFPLLLVGWGGVGLASYLLISYYYDRLDDPELAMTAANAGVKAFVVNAIGDVGLLLATFMLFSYVGAVDYDTVFRSAAQAFRPDDPAIMAICFLLLMAAAAKSGQLPLHVWLPDAMAGPTPVSALIHAATMVTAGVYLVARTHPLYELAPTMMGVVAVIGAVTAIFAATIGLVQPNIKRVLAYSTVSQLGYMFVAVGVGAYAAAAFHLLTHAFFKAALFLAAGSVIHALHGEENLARMGGLRTTMPTTYRVFAVGAGALAGFPLLSGFFSKDEILAEAFSRQWMLGLLLLVSVGFTSFYIFRALFLAFHGSPRAGTVAAHGGHEAPASMRIPMIVLGILSAIGGIIQLPVPGLEGLSSWLAPTFERYVHHAEHGPTINWSVMGASIMLFFVGAGLAYRMYVQRTPDPEALGAQFRPLHRILLNRYYVDEIYYGLVIWPYRALAGFLADVLDRGIIDGLVNTVGLVVHASAVALRHIQTGYVRNYALAILGGVVVIVTYLLQTLVQPGGRP